MTRDQFISTFAHFMSEHDLNASYDSHFKELSHMNYYDIKDWLENILNSKIAQGNLRKKPVMIADEGFDAEVSSHLCCSNCNQPIVNVWSSRLYKPKFCHYCGQEIAWGGEDNEEH